MNQKVVEPAERQAFEKKMAEVRSHLGWASLQLWQLWEMFQAGAAFAREQPGWISVEERLPKDGELVMFWQPPWVLWEAGQFRATEQMFETEVTYGYDDEHRNYSSAQITHWMPQFAIALPAIGEAQLKI